MARVFIHNVFDGLRGWLWATKPGCISVLAGLGTYLFLWTLYGAIAKASQDLHPDMLEKIIWSRNLDFGFLKHPPLAALLVRMWFNVFPLSDWTFYLLAMLVSTLALLSIWSLSKEYLKEDKLALALAVVTLIPFFNFHALKFNENTLLMPLWAATTMWFLRSYRTLSPAYGALAGIAAAGAM